MKLLESFPAIAKPPHRLIYSTHSHYMVDPKWLEQAYIVFNASTSDAQSIIDEGVAKDSDIDIKAVPYRQFIHEYPDKISYFQPILDTLDVKPSKFDYKNGGLIVEGKYDYYCVLLACKVVGTQEMTVFPAIGSGTMGALVALHRGWGLPVRVLFDADQGGKDGKKKLSREFSLLEEETHTVNDINKNMNRMEDIFSESDKNKLVDGKSGSPKTVMLRNIQEILAAGVDFEFEEETRDKMSDLVSRLKEICPNAFIN